jgi:phosphatidylinositol alpha-1,6-mannosyltransferase
MLLVLSSLFGATGGIPAFNRLLLRAAVEDALDFGEPLSIVALTDDPQQLPDAMLGAALRYVPCGGDRRRCVAETARAAGRFSPILFGHVNLATPGLLLRPLGSRFGVIAHGTEVWSPLPWHRRLPLRQAHVVACVSDDTLQRVRAVQGVSEARCLRIINAISTLPPSGVSDPTADRPLRLLSVTRLHPGEPKGIDLTLRALYGLPAGSFRYTVIGEGADRPRLQALAASLGLAAQVHFAGAVDDAARDRALADCDLFVLPSSGEGFGIVYLEAMARGKPCLGARVGGTPEVVLDEQTGLLVEPNVESVRAGLRKLYDPALRQRLGQAGRRRVEAHFTYDAFRRHAVRLFTRLRSDG